MAETIGFSARIVEELRSFTVPLNTVQLHPLNSRKHRIDRIMSSLEAHGQRSLVVAQKSTGHIVKGNGTWTAAKQLGWTELAISIQEMTDDEALAYLYADNRASDGSSYDMEMHLKGLERLMAGPGAAGTLWTDDDIEDLRESLHPLVELDAATDAAHTHEQAGEAGAESQAKRESGAQNDQERLKDVRFPLTLSDHAEFVERLKVLQKRYGTAGAIATILETVKRQAEAEGVGGKPMTGRQLDEATRKSYERGIKQDIKAMLHSLPGDTVAIATVVAMLGDVPDPEPQVPDVAPGQLEMGDLGANPPTWDPADNPDAAQAASGDWSDVVAAQTATMRPPEVSPLREQPSEDDVDGLAELARIRAQAAAPAPAPTAPIDATAAAAGIFDELDDPA